MINRSLLPLFLIFNFYFLICSCSAQKQIARQAKTILLEDTNIAKGHIGISIYEPATGKYWYNYDATKYFVPASNTKLFTLYAGMKYLGDSLVGLRYEKTGSDQTTIAGTGDPTFLHPDFKDQPVLDFIKKEPGISYLYDVLTPSIAPLGYGWAWDDYGDDYMAERSELPIYGNVVTFNLQGDTVAVEPPYFYNYSFQWLNGTLKNGVSTKFKIVRPFEENAFHGLYPSSSKFTSQQVPFKINNNPGNKEPLFLALLEDTLHRKLGRTSSVDRRFIPKNIIHSQPTDSLFKPMMHRSDNFFAEQTLLMVSNEKLGYMNDKAIIDTLLNTDLKDVPQKPNWVDGCGLSRYNLFTPQSFVYILNKMKDEFGMDRLKAILATGGEGTIKNYYQKDAGFIFAKTGTLSNHCALSGFLYTEKGKLLIFSILTNHYQGGATPIRKAVERFLESIRHSY